MSDSKNTLLDLLYSKVDKNPSIIIQSQKQNSLINDLLKQHPQSTASPVPNMFPDNLYSPLPLIIRALALAVFIPGIIIFFVSRKNLKELTDRQSRQTVRIDGIAASDGKLGSVSSRRNVLLYTEAPVDYTYEGKTYTKVFRNNTSWKPKKGDIIPLAMNPDDPEDCSNIETDIHENHKTGTAGQILMIIGICLYILGIIFTILQV